MRIKTKIILSVLGGVNSVFYIFTPILIGTIWLSLFITDGYSIFVFTIGLLSTLFRAIKVGGFIDDEDLLKRLLRRKDG